MNPRLCTFSMALGMVALTGLLLTPVAAQVNTCPVTSLEDSGPGTLRDHIGNPSCQIIDFSGVSLPAVITLTSGQLTIDRELTINGPGAATLTVTTNYASVAFWFTHSAAASISGLTVSGSGGALVNVGGNVRLTGVDVSDNLVPAIVNSSYFGSTYKQGTMILDGSRVSRNKGSGGEPWASNGWGGGIYNNFGTMTIIHSTVSDNENEVGAGIANEGNLTITYSTISGNAAIVGGGIAELTGIADAPITIAHTSLIGNTAGEGGGIYMGGSTPMVVINSTISGNHASSSGGGIYHVGFELTLTHATVSGNSAPMAGGIYTAAWLPTHLRNAIVARNLTGGNCVGATTDGGYNLDDDASCGFTAAGSWPNTDPLLDPAGLQDNGGPTRTIALQPGSPAINAIPLSDGSCYATGVVEDQRGVGRPQPAGGACDIGAFEHEQAPGFAFFGFFAPVANDSLNAVKAGQAVPVRFSLGANHGLSIFAGGYPATQQIACDLLGGTSQVTETTNAGNSSLAYDATTDTYTFVWKTDKGWSNSCRQLLLRFTDGTTKNAEFRFTK
jgi:hypothetical protein